jgi:hypothetical protein
MKIGSVTSHFTLHNAKKYFLAHTFHISSPISVKFYNRRCSYNFLEHFWISRKSVREKCCFTCRPKLNFDPYFLHHPANLAKFDTGQGHKCALSFCKFRGNLHSYVNLCFHKPLPIWVKVSAGNLQIMTQSVGESFAKIRAVKVLPTIQT